jgi:5'-3' exonuclease
VWIAARRAPVAARSAVVVRRAAIGASTAAWRARFAYDEIVFLHLLDATYELFRAYFGFPKRLAPDGREVGATLGVIETTLSLLREPEVSHVGAATDTVIESFRNDLFDGYKTGAGIEPDLWAQFPLAERALRTLGVVVWPMREFEADDAIATAALRWVDDVEKVIILSPDKDLMQCVVDNAIVSFNRRESMEIDEDGVREKFGISPVSIPDYLALVGDTADGVPGIPSWGAKSASTLLARYERIERIPSDPGDWDVKVRGAARLSENLEANRDAATLYRTLTTLRRDVPIQETLADLEWRGVHRTDFEALCDELGFNDVRTRPHRWQD